LSIDFLESKEWRMNNLYRVVNKQGDSVAFRLNAVQQEVLTNLHSRNLILKARQLGMSTFAVLYLLDEAIFNDNISAGIVSYSLEHAQHIFKRIIGHALDSLTPIAKQLCGIVQRSAREITFVNGSYLRVDTTLRGGAYQLVLVSEFGKTCARNPIKAEEVVTGTLQSVPSTGRIIIESTGEGNDGFYTEMVTQSAQRGNEDISDLDYKLFFFPWYSDPLYAMQKNVPYPVELTDYFDDIEEKAHVKITRQQRNWYAQQMGVLGDKVKQEFPSTISEAFLSNADAYYFQQCIERAYNTNRMLSISPYDALEPVYVAMDIGVNDLTVLVFFQVVHGEIRIIDYYSDNGKGVDFYSHMLQQEKRYLYHTIFLPHDAKKRDGIIVENTYEREFKKLFQNSDTKFIVLKQTDKNINITNAKIKFDRCVFNINRVKPLIDMLGKYRKQWSEQYGKYLDKPYHDVSSNFADALIYTLQAVTHIETVGGKSSALERHKKAVENRRLSF
jgi:hypothetical protein